MGYFTFQLQRIYKSDIFYANTNLILTIINTYKNQLSDIYINSLIID